MTTWVWINGRTLLFDWCLVSELSGSLPIDLNLPLSSLLSNFLSNFPTLHFFGTSFLQKSRSSKVIDRGCNSSTTNSAALNGKKRHLVWISFWRIPSKIFISAIESHWAMKIFNWLKVAWWHGRIASIGTNGLNCNGFLPCHCNDNVDH